MNSDLCKLNSEKMSRPITLRIPFSGITVTDLSDSGIDPGQENQGGNPGESSSINFPTLNPLFGFLPAELPSYPGLPPQAEISFVVPADDFPRVKAWFTGNYQGVTLPASPTLNKNMTNAVLGALSTYFANANARNLFTSPFMAMLAYRLSDGSLVKASEPQLLVPNAEAPLLPIKSRTLTEKFITTTVEILNYPSRLTLSLPPFGLSEEFKEIIKHLEIIITEPTDLYSSSAIVAGVRSVLIEEERKSCWYYAHPDATEVAANAIHSSPFRTIATFSFSDLCAGLEETVITPAAGALTRFSSLPKAVAGDGSDYKPADNDKENPLTTGSRPYIDISTEALDFGFPDNNKRLRRLSLRGIFDRDKIVMRLYGSHHREGWKHIATARGPYISGLTATGFRWYRLEVESAMRPGDFLDALTVSFSI